MLIFDKTNILPQRNTLIRKNTTVTYKNNLSKGLTCIVSGCNRHAHYRGFCHKHGRLINTNGYPLTQKELRKLHLTKSAVTRKNRYNFKRNSHIDDKYINLYKEDIKDMLNIYLPNMTKELKIDIMKKLMLLSSDSNIINIVFSVNYSNKSQRIKMHEIMQKLYRIFFIYNFGIIPIVKNNNYSKKITLGYLTKDEKCL